MAENFTDFESYKIPLAHREVYKTIGGTPHLDQNYTVFGQVIEGLDVIDSIAKVKVDTWDRPVSDVRLLSVRLK
jgi:peptidyl-prolyl cis-trans isomerase B (cyclophilin B)